MFSYNVLNDQSRKYVSSWKVSAVLDVPLKCVVRLRKLSTEEVAYYLKYGCSELYNSHHRGSKTASRNFKSKLKQEDSSPAFKPNFKASLTVDPSDKRQLKSSEGTDKYSSTGCYKKGSNKECKEIRSIHATASLPGGPDHPPVKQESSVDGSLIVGRVLASSSSDVGSQVTISEGEEDLPDIMSPPLLSSSQIPASRKSRLSLSRNRSFSGSSSTGQCRSLSELNDSSLDLNLDDLQSCSTSLNSLQVACENASFLPNEPYSQCRPLSKLNDSSLDLRTDEVDDLRSSLNSPQVACENASFLPNEPYNFDQKETDTCIVSQNLKTLQKQTSPDVHRSRSLLSCSSLASNSTPSGGLKNVKAISNYEESNSAHKVGTSVLKVKQAQRKLKLKNPCLEKKLINKNSEALYMTNSLRYESVEQFKGEPTGNSKQHRASKHKGFTFKRNPSAGVKVSMESSETKSHLEIETLISKKFQPKKEKSVSSSKKQCDHSKPSCSEASEHSSTRTSRVFSSTASSSPGFSSDSFGTSFGTILNPLALKCSAQNLAWRNGTSLSGVKHHKTHSFDKKEKVLKTKGVLNVSKKGKGSKGQSLKKKLAKQYSLPSVTRPVTMPPKWDSTKSSTLPKQASPSSLVSGESQMPNTLSRAGKAVVRGGLDALPNSLNDDRERLTMALMTPLNAPPDDEACSNTVRPISLSKNPASTFGWNVAENLKNVWSKFPQLPNRLQSSINSNKRKRVAVAETHCEKRAKYQKTDDFFVESGLPKKGLENVVDNYNGFSIAGKCSQCSGSLKKSCHNLKEKHVEKNASSPQEKKVFLPIQKNKVSNRDKVEISVQPENTNVSTHRSRNIGSNQCEEHLLSDKQKDCAISLGSEKNEASVKRTIAGINGQKNIAPFQSRKEYTEIKPEKGNNLIRSQADKDRNYSLISQGNVQSGNSVSLNIKEKREISIETEKDVDSMQPSENEARVLIRDESIKMKERRPSFPSRNETSNLHTKTSPRIRRMSDKSSSQSEQKQTSVKSKQKKRKKQKISVEYITDETDSSGERTSLNRAVQSDNFPTPKPSDNSELTTRKTSYLSEPSENSDQPGFNLSHFGQDSRKNIIRQIGNYTMQGVNATLPLGKRKSFVQPCTNTALKKGSRAVCENIPFSAGNTDKTIKSSACTSSVRTRVNSDSMELPHSRLGYGVQEKCSRRFGESTREVHMKQNLNFNVPPLISRKTYKGKKDHESTKTSTTKNGPSFLLHYINENNRKSARNLSVCEKSVMKKKRSSNAKEVVSSSWFDKLFFPSNKEEFEQLNATTGTLVDLNVTRARKRIVQSWSNEALQLKLSEQRSKQEQLKRLKQHLAKAMKILNRNLETFTKILERKAVSSSTPSTCQSYESSVSTRELTASPMTDSTAPKAVCTAPQGGSTALQVDSILPQTDFTAHRTDFPRVHVDCLTHEMDSTVVQGNATSCCRQTTLHKENFSSQSLSTSSKQGDSHEVHGNIATGVLNANVPTKAIRAAGSNSLNNQIESCHESIEGMKLDVRASELKTTSTENNTDTNRGESESGLAPSCKVIEKNEATNNCESLANDRNSVEKKIQSTGKAPTNFECEDSTPTMSPCLSLSQIGDTDNHGETSSEKSGTDSENNVQESVTDTLNSSQSMIPRITSSPSQTRDEPDTNTTANRSSESTKHFTDNAVVSVQKLDSTNDSKCMFVRSASEDLAPRMKQEVMSPYSDVGLIAREMRDSFESGFLNSIVKREIKLETDATDSHEDSPCPSHCENSFNFDANELNERADVLKSGATNPLTSNTSYATAAPMVVIQTPFIWPKNEYQLPEMGEDSDSDVTVVFEDAEEEVGNSNLGISPVSKSTGCPLKKGIKEQTSEKTTEVSLVQPTPARDVQGTSDGGVSSNVSEMPKTSQESVSNHDINKFTSSEAIDSPESSENLSVFDSSNFNHSDYVKKDDGILKSLNTHREKQNSNLFAPNSSILENMSNDFGISAVKNLESENDSISCSKENNSSNAYDQSCVQSSEPKSKIVSIFDSDDELPDLNINLSKQSKDISKGSNNPESETNSRIGAGDGFIKTSSVDVNSEECLTSHATITSANTDCNANSSLLALKSDSGHHVRAEPNKAIPVKHGCCSSTDEFESEIPPTAPNDENKYSKLSAASNESSSPAPVSSMTSKNRGKRGNCTATAYKPSLRVQNTSAKTNARGKKQRPCTARYNANKIQVRMNLTANNENIQSKEVENGNSGSSSVFSSCLSLTKPASNPKGCALLEPMSSALRSDVSNDDPGFSMPNIPAPFVGEKPQVNTSVTPSSDCSNNHGTEIKENVNLPDFKHDSSFLQPNKSVFYSNASSYAHNSQASGDNTAQNIQSKHQSFGSHQTLRPPYSSNVSSTQAYMGNPNPLTYSQNSLNKMPNTLISQLQPGVYMSNVPNIGYQIIPSKTDQNLVTPLQSPSILLRNPFISLQTSCVIPQTSFVIPQTSSALLQNPGGVHISPATVILNATSLLSNPTPMHNNSAAIVENQPNTFGNPKVTLENLVVSLPNSHAKLQSPAATLQSPLATHSSKLHGISSRSNELEMRWIQNHLMNTSRNWTSRALCNTIDVSQAKEDPCPRAISDTNLPKSVAELCSSSGSLISNQGSAIKIQVVPPLHNPSSVANVPQSESINKAETPGPAVKNGSRERPVLSVNNMSVTQGMSSLKRVLTDKMPLNMNKKEHDELFKQPKKKKVYSKVQAASESNKVSLQESYCGNGENSVLNASESAPKLPRELQSHSQLESTMCHVPSNGGDSNSNIVSKVGHPFMDSSKQNLSQKQFLAQMALETNMPAFDSSYVQEKLPVNVETSISTSLVTNSSWKPTCISDQILFNRNDQKTQESLNAFIESPSMVEISDDGNKKFNTDSIDAEPMITDDQDALQYGNNSSNGATHRAVCDLVSNETCNLKTSHIETSSGPHKNVESVKQSTPATVIVSPGTSVSSSFNVEKAVPPAYRRKRILAQKRMPSQYIPESTKEKIRIQKEKEATRKEANMAKDLDLATKNQDKSQRSRDQDSSESNDVSNLAPVERDWSSQKSHVDERSEGDTVIPLYNSSSSSKNTEKIEKLKPGENQSPAPDKHKVSLVVATSSVVLPSNPNSLLSVSNSTSLCEQTSTIGPIYTESLNWLRTSKSLDVSQSLISVLPSNSFASSVVTDSTKSPITSATVAPNVRTSQMASNTSHRTVVILNVSEKDDILHNTSGDGTSNIILPASTNSVVLSSVISSNLSVQKGDKDATESKLQNMPIEFDKSSGSTSGLQNPSSFPRQRLPNSGPMVQKACNAAMRFPCWRSSTTLFPSKLVDQSSSLRLPRGHKSSSFLSHRGQPLILPPRAQAQHILQPQISVHSRMQVPASVIPPQTKASLTVRPLQMDAFTSSQTPQLRTGGIAQQSQTYPLLRPVQTSPRPFHTQPGLFVRPVAPHMPQSAAQSPFFMGQNLPPNATNPSSRPLGSSYGLNLPLRSLLPSSDGKSVVTSVSCTQSSFPAQLRSVGTTTIYAEGSLCPNHVDGQPARDSRNPTLPSNSSNWPAASHAGAERHHIESQLKKENNHLQSNLKQRERGGNQNTDSFHSSNSIFRSAAPMQLASQPGTSRSEHIPSIQGVSVSSTEGSLARCAVCGKTNEEMARCCVVSYCSLNCQKQHWPVHAVCCKHKSVLQYWQKK